MSGYQKKGGTKIDRKLSIFFDFELEAEKPAVSQRKAKQIHFFPHMPAHSRWNQLPDAPVEYNRNIVLAICDTEVLLG